MKTTTKIFGPEDISRAARILGFDAMMRQMIERLQQDFSKYDKASTPIPLRDGFHYDSPAPGLIEWMPVMERGRHALMKLVSYHPRNPGTNGMPTILSSFSLIDVNSGHMIAITDGTFLTALRTGAASAVATRALAKPDARTLGIIGCGAQGVTQLHALCQVMPFDLILYWDTEAEARQSFIRRVLHLLPDGVRLRESPVELIVPNVDVLCTATSIDVGAGPLFEEFETRSWLHINAVGSDFPGKVEIPRTLVQKSVAIPDFAGQALVEGECQQLDAADVGPELYQLLQDNAFDALRSQRTLFDSTGWALEDLAAMELLVEWAETFDLGRDVHFENITDDPKDPYWLAETASDSVKHQR